MSSGMEHRAGFSLQFDPGQIRSWASRYDAKGDERALAAGKRIAHGRYNRDDFEEIFIWKTNGRGISRIRRNEEAEIDEALRFATAAETPRCAMAVLCGLSGVEVPVASAVMTAIHPDRYTIIDFRALEALGANGYSPNLNFYLDYLRHCQRLAKKNNVSLRTLDRAMWQWSKERPSRHAALRRSDAHPVSPKSD